MAEKDTRELSPRMLETLRTVLRRDGVHDTTVGRRMAGLHLTSVESLRRRGLLHTVYDSGKRWIELTEAGAEAVRTQTRPVAESEKTEPTLRLILEVTVNAEDWKLTYGPSQPVRDDVADYILDQVNQSPAAEECGLSVERVQR